MVMGLAATSGCLVVPKTIDTPSVVGVEREDIVPQRRTAMGVELSSVGGMILVRALSPRVCTRETWHVLDIKHEKTADLEIVPVGGGSPGDFIVLLFAPVTLAVSGLVTGIIVASSDTTYSRDRKQVASTPYECPVPHGSVAVSLTLASGAMVELVTDAHGEARFEVPREDADAGDILVGVGGSPPRVVHYCRGACPPGNAPVVVARPLPAPAIAPRDVAAPMPAVDPAQHAADRAACLARRSERMRAAQQVSDLKERTRQLTSLPVCPP
jgi:hypothetical protein